MKIIVIGLGQMGGNYVRLLQKADIAPSDIIGVDIDPVKVEAARGKFPGVVIGESIDAVWDSNITAAIVATNTPSHHRVLCDLMDRGVKYLLTEKPLGINHRAANEIGEMATKCGANVYTAFLMNFSPAVLHLIQQMEAQNLVLAEGSVTWGKNRYGDKRPTPGDLEDETVHGAGILHALCSVNQKILSASVFAKMTYPEFASAEAQAKARSLDESFPERVNASTMVIEHLQTDVGEVHCVLHSSFIHPAQTRRVTAVLSRRDNPLVPVYSAELNFDMRESDTADYIIDRLITTTLDGNSVDPMAFMCDKLFTQVQAFLVAASGEKADPRLAPLAEAVLAVSFSEAIVRSHQNGGIARAF